MPDSLDVSLYLHTGSGNQRFVIHPFIRHKVETTHIVCSEVIKNPFVDFSTDITCLLSSTTKEDYDKQAASPEVLLESHEQGFQTVALAGTLPANGDVQPNWSDKEIDEQQIIVDYVSRKLSLKNIPFTVSPQQSSRAGNVYHLKSVFRSKAVIDPVEVALMLHPGPAISGYPILPALDFIQTHEKHDREHYCGFLGPVSDSRTSLFINLRCMQVFSDAVALYIGGGFTKDSDPTDEWQETELKLTNQAYND